MNLLLQTAAAAMIAVVLIVLLKRNTPELSYLLAVVSAAAVLGVFLLLFLDIREYLDELSAAAGLSSAVTAPVFKAMGIGLVTKLASDVCSDAGQSAVAACLELTGSAGAVYAALPLMRGVFDMIGGLL